MVGYGGKDLQKKKVLSLEWKSEGVMDDESGESMEPMEEVPLIELGEAELERLVRGWRRVAGSWFQYRPPNRSCWPIMPMHLVVHGTATKRFHPSNWRPLEACCRPWCNDATYGDPQVLITSRKPTTQQLKTVVLWVFWTLALVDHRSDGLPRRQNANMMILMMITMLELPSLEDL